LHNWHNLEKDLLLLHQELVIEVARCHLAVGNSLSLFVGSNHKSA